MKWVPDKTGRFGRRPHYQPEEIDAQCERLIQKFLSKKYGKVEFPILTDDLTILVEERADLDSATDLSHEEGEVEGDQRTPARWPARELYPGSVDRRCRLR